MLVSEGADPEFKVGAEFAVFGSEGGLFPEFKVGGELTASGSEGGLFGGLLGVFGTKAGGGGPLVGELTV